MSLLQVSSSRLGRTPDCPDCETGSLVSFNWKYAKKESRPDRIRDLSVFIVDRQLRWGALYRCKTCNKSWYLDGDAEFMNFVEEDRLPLIKQWNEHQIYLSLEQDATLDKIGRTPPDHYGNGANFHETPCTVITKSGERVDLAIISRQKHPPFEDWRQYRLASEIDEIFPSPFALPLAVRMATSVADEIRMGFAPTLVEMPNGNSVVLNWRHNFIVRSDCNAGDVVLSQRRINMDTSPEIYSSPKNIIYFVADWPEKLNQQKSVSSADLPEPKSGILRKISRYLLGRERPKAEPN